MFFIFIFKNKKNSKIYAGLEKLRKWGPVARWGGDRDLYVRSIGDRDLYVKKNNYILADGAGRPTEGGRSPVQRATGYRVMGVQCRATVAS